MRVFLGKSAVENFIGTILTLLFTVEKANNATGNYEKLVLVNNKSNDDAMNNYETYDVSPVEGDNTYRARVNYSDGSTQISESKTVSFKAVILTNLFPNPAIDEAWVDLKSYQGNAVTLIISDMSGKIIQQQVVQSATRAPYRLDLSEMQSGLYLLKIQATGKRALLSKLQIAK